MPPAACWAGRPKSWPKSADVARETISKIEAGLVQPHEKTMASIARVFDENGVEFTANEGVRLKPRSMEIYEGEDGFAENSMTLCMSISANMAAMYVSSWIKHKSFFEVSEKS